MGFYDDLGVRRIVNAATTFTALGGSLMPPEVLDAMRSAAGSFVDIHELHLAAGRRLAAATGNEAAYVTSGCAGDPAIAVLPHAPSGATVGFWLSPDLLQPGEAELVAAQVRRQLEN
jgi:L-seryl-tRNA(Ser) seleniumtransferase